MKENPDINPQPLSSESFEFSYDEYLAPYRDALDTLSAPEIPLYRWVHNPFIDDDALPQIFQSSDPRTPEDLTPPSSDAPIDVKISYINNFALSHFISPEVAIARFHELRKRLQKKKGELAAAKFAEHVGQWIVKYQYTSDSARVGETDKKGHVNVFIKKDVDINDFRDNTFKPINTLE